METHAFLSLVTPDEGVRYVTIIQQKVNAQQKFTKVANIPYSTHEEGVELITEAEADKTINVYFSCASFAQEEYVDGNGKRKQRTAENAAFARAIWRDLDVGLNEKGEPKPNAYASQADAVGAIAELCEKTGLPSPLIVSSGNGIHAYWPFNRNVPKDEWLRLASMAQQAFPKLGLKSDSSRDCDIASVLRPPGTTNKGKTLNHAKLPVEVWAEPDKVLDPDDFVAILSPFAVVTPLDDVPEFMRGSSSTTESLAKQHEYPPSFAEIVATKCAQIGSFRDTGGTGYQTWWLGVGFCKHTVEGEAKAHEWSAKYEGYNRAETQRKLDSWEKGPPTCESFADAGGLCSKCEFKDKVRSPITLGYEENPPQQVVEIEADIEDQVSDKVLLPERYAFRDGFLQQLVMVEGKAEYVRITPTLFWLEDRHWSTSGEMVFGVMSRVRQNKNGKWQYRYFDLPASKVGKGGIELHGALGQNEIFAVDKGARPRMDSLVAAMAEQLKKRVDETRAYRTFGWQDDGGFLLGDQRIDKEKVLKVKVVGDSAPSFLPAFSKNSYDAPRWSEIVEAMYVHPNHAAYQMVVLFGIGSALLRFYQMPTGCLVNIVGEKGTGKTTAARVGLSAYGNPDMLMTELRSTTELALYNRLATLHSIPCSIDEMTNIEPVKASNMIYSIMNGQPRDGMRSDGRRRDQLVPWQTVTFGSANGSIIELLATFKGNASAEMSRLIEIDWPKVETIKRREMDDLLEDLRHHYGSIGLAFVTWIVQNEEKAQRILFTMRKFIEDELKIDKENRFWSAHMAVPLAAKMILQEMDLLNGFDLDELLSTCLSAVKTQTESVDSLTLDSGEAFNVMLTAFSGNLITTRSLKDNRFATPDGVIMNGEPVGRAILDTNDLYLSIASVRKWCSEQRMSYKSMRSELVASKALVGEERFYLGRGTTRLTGQTYCWHLDLSKVQGFSHPGDDPAVEAGHLRLVKP
jgi:hypothetical protein